MPGAPDIFTTKHASVATHLESLGYEFLGITERGNYALKKSDGILQAALEYERRFKEKRTAPRYVQQRKAA
jgi:hypothetical protein